MRSVAPSALPSALLNPDQTRSLPTRVVNVSSGDDQAGVTLPEKGEPLRIVGDVSKVSDNPLVRKALKRLTAEMAPTSLTQLVMLRLSGGLEWDAIAELSQKWANAYELTLAKDFVQRLESLPDGETGRLLFQVDGKDEAGESFAAEVRKAINSKMVLGLIAHVGEIPARARRASRCVHPASEREGSVRPGFQHRRDRGSLGEFRQVFSAARAG